MTIVRRISDISLDGAKTVALVPTMGAFHEGHLTLMRAARSYADTVAVSLFVNPTQFGSGEDYSAYPRAETRDFALAEAAGVDLIFVPSASEMYSGNAVSVKVGALAARWEGEFRPGHFDGVATVVAKLFNIVRPDFALFGLKDFQQCAVIRQLVLDLNFPVFLKFHETVREPDGLAMSSRNVYLTEQERQVAPILHEELSSLSRKLSLGFDTESLIDKNIAGSKATLERAGFRVQYLDWIDSESLEPMRSNARVGRLIAAVYLGKTRLIDNVSA